MSGIGTLNERPLHRSLKAWYAEPGDRFEVAIDGFVIDIVRDDLLVEIQTANFSSIRRKLEALTASRRVRLVYPIAFEKWIVKPAVNGRRGPTRRKSPRRGRVEDVFWELVSIPHLLADTRFSVEVLMTREDEARRYDPRRGWRTKGWIVDERRLIEVVDRKLFRTPADWIALIPKTLSSFTAADLAETLKIPLDLAQKTAYSLRKTGVVEVVGKRGRAHLYEVGQPTEVRGSTTEIGRS